MNKRGSCWRGGGVCPSDGEDDDDNVYNRTAVSWCEGVWKYLRASVEVRGPKYCENK